MAGPCILMGILTAGLVSSGMGEPSLLRSLSDLFTEGKLYDTKRAADSCVPMTAPICQGGRYNMTRFPNLRHHTSQEDALLELHQFAPLIKVNCSPYLRPLLCSLYLPVCWPGQPFLISPCPGICQKAREGCEPLMKKFGFAWPEFLECSNFSEAFMKTRVCIDLTRVNPVSFYTTPAPATAEPTTTAEPANSVSQIPQPEAGQKPLPSEPGSGSNITFEGEIHLKNCHCVCRP